MFAFTQEYSYRYSNSHPHHYYHYYYIITDLLQANMNENMLHNPLHVFTPIASTADHSREVARPWRLEPLLMQHRQLKATSYTNTWHWPLQSVNQTSL